MNQITGRHDPNPFCLACINCASNNCCPPPKAHLERVSILCALGMDEDAAHKASALMLEKGIVFFPAAIANAIADFVDHPGRHAALPVLGPQRHPSDSPLPAGDVVRTDVLRPEDVRPEFES